MGIQIQTTLSIEHQDKESLMMVYGIKRLMCAETLMESQ